MPLTSYHPINRTQYIFHWAGRIMEWNLPWGSGIYPSEMAVFLGVCDKNGIKTIVESGRGPDAYSTRVLGCYSEEKKDVTVWSIDVSPLRKHKYHNMLQDPDPDYCCSSVKCFDNLYCKTGNSWIVMPCLLSKSKEPRAILIDGPKGKQQIWMSRLMNRLFDIKITAQHNTMQGYTEGNMFRKRFPDAEWIDRIEDPLWDKFREWERENTNGYELFDPGVPPRSLSLSSLAFAVSP